MCAASDITVTSGLFIGYSQPPLDSFSLSLSLSVLPVRWSLLLMIICDTYMREKIKQQHRLDGAHGISVQYYHPTHSYYTHIYEY